MTRQQHNRQNRADASDDREEPDHGGQGSPAHPPSSLVVAQSNRREVSTGSGLQPLGPFTDARVTSRRDEVADEVVVGNLVTPRGVVTRSPRRRIRNRTSSRPSPGVDEVTRLGPRYVSRDEVADEVLTRLSGRPGAPRRPAGPRRPRRWGACGGSPRGRRGARAPDGRCSAPARPPRWRPSPRGW